MHQLQWMAAIAELEEKEGLVVPSTFDQQYEKQEVSYAFMNCSKGTESVEGRWASGATPDGKAQFKYIENPEAIGTNP